MANLTEEEKARAKEIATQQAAADMKAGKDAWADYGKGVEELNKAMNDLGNDITNLKSSGSALGGNIGKLISDTKLKANANAGQYPTASIIKRAARNVVEFPVFISSSVPIEYATATNSLLEQMYASFLQMAISQNPVIPEEAARSGDIFKGLGLKSDVSKYLEYAELPGNPDYMFYAKDACHNTITSDDCIVEFSLLSIDNNTSRIINEAVDYQPLSEFDHYFQEAATNEKIEKLEKQIEDLEEEEEDLEDSRRLSPNHPELFQDKEKTRIKEVKDELKDLRKELREAKKEVNSNAMDIMNRVKAADDIGILDSETGRAMVVGDDGKMKPIAAHTRKDREEARKQQDEERKNKAEARDAEMHPLNKAKAKAELAPRAPQLMDETKINKLNSMKPLMMTVGLRIMQGNNISDVIDYVVGVKTHCRVIPAEVLPDFAEYPSKTMNFVSRKARWRAGELKFVDYLFSRKEKKQAAYDSRDPKRKWYHRLYTLAHSKGSSKAAKRITGSSSGEGLIPNVTVVLSKADVDMIEATNGIDLLKGSTAKRICQELFLISIVVIDTDSQSLKMFLPDTMNDYEVHSLASVNKQLATLDSASDVSREVTKLMRGR